MLPKSPKYTSILSLLMHLYNILEHLISVYKYPLSFKHFINFVVFNIILYNVFNGKGFDLVGLYLKSLNVPCTNIITFAFLLVPSIFTILDGIILQPFICSSIVFNSLTISISLSLSLLKNFIAIILPLYSPSPSGIK